MRNPVSVRIISLVSVILSAVNLTACNSLSRTIKKNHATKNANYVLNQTQISNNLYNQDYEQKALNAYKKGNYAESSKYLKQQLSFIQLKNKQLVPTLSRLYFNLGLSQLKQGLNAAAETYFETGLPLAKATFNHEHLMLARYYANLGTARIRQEKYQAAIEPLKQAIAIKTRLFGAKNKQLLPEYRRLHKAYKKLNSKEFTTQIQNKIREIN